MARLRGIAAALAATVVAADDPASSWLVYAIAPGNGTRVTSVNATWVVPSFPTDRNAPNAPGYWFGIEPRPADMLIQPILAYGDGAESWTIFNGFFDWHNNNWEQSGQQTVKPGDVVTASVTWDARRGIYDMYIAANGGAPIHSARTKSESSSEVYTDVYFVVEKQPTNCAQNPSNGFVLFTNISIAWAGVVAQDPAWAVHQFQPACNSQGEVVSPSSVKFTWNTQ